jgi:predicted membrane protein
VAVLNSIPDCNVSQLDPLLIPALLVLSRFRIPKKSIRRIKKGKVVRVVRNAIAGPWWASAWLLGTAALAIHGESG